MGSLSQWSKGLLSCFKPFSTVITQREHPLSFLKFKVALRNFEDTEKSDIHNTNLLLVDDGATTHIINDKAKFVNFGKSFRTTKHIIELTYGSRLNNTVRGRGEATVTLIDTKGNANQTTLKNALYIPTFSHSIFSVQAAISQGASEKFSQNCATLSSICTDFMIQKRGSVDPIFTEGHKHALCCADGYSGRLTLRHPSASESGLMIYSWQQRTGQTLKERKSETECEFELSAEGVLISWKSKKQPTVAPQRNLNLWDCCIMRLLTKIGAFASVVAGSTYYARTSDNVSSLGIVRFGRAAFTAARIAVDYKILFHRLEKTDSQYPEEIHKLHLKSAYRLRDLCCQNGGAFIKVGQHIGTLEYLLPMEYVQTMKVLHSEAPQSPLEELKTVIHEDLGQTVENMFVEFDPEPLGAASLAQVHKAKMSDGRVVAVKIQHPKVKAHSFVDIRTMEFLVHALGLIFPEFDYIWLAEETKKNLPVELDFLNEGKNCERVGRLLKKFKFLKVPKIYWEFSSERVLTMEYCEGGKVDDVKYMKENNISVN
ncbi:hypothetical protein RRG08_060215, partial [Elysia crispata]